MVGDAAHRQTAPSDLSTTKTTVPQAADTVLAWNRNLHLNLKSSPARGKAIARIHDRCGLAFGPVMDVATHSPKELGFKFRY